MLYVYYTYSTTSVEVCQGVQPERGMGCAQRDTECAQRGMGCPCYGSGWLCLFPGDPLLHADWAIPAPSIVPLPIFSCPEPEQADTGVDGSVCFQTILACTRLGDPGSANCSVALFFSF